MNLINIIANLLKNDLPYPGFKGGWVPSPVDYRDVPASALFTSDSPIPATYQEPFPLFQKQQGSNPFCVGESGSTLLEYDKQKAGLLDIEFDGAWLYNECKKIDGIPNVQGTYYRAALSVLKNKGCKPVNGTDADAANYKIAAYVQVDDMSFDGLKRAIFTFGTIMMGFHIYSNGSWQNAYITIPAGSTIVAGHATVGRGYNDQYIIGKNSWGPYWGDNGNFYVPANYLPYEAWAITQDLPSHLIPNQNPKPQFQFKNPLYFGLQNTEVQQLQECLVWIGCLDREHYLTGPGVFGGYTLQAVKLFQQRYNIPTTGYVGPLTMAKLNELFA